MAYWYDDTSSRANTSRRCVNYIADTESDINDLPTSTTEGAVQGNDTTLHRCVDKGSSCLVIDTGAVYMLNSNNQWVQL